jgi:hypothetical protein
MCGEAAEKRPRGAGGCETVARMDVSAGRYQFEGNAGGTIERCDPPSGLAVTWESGGSTAWVGLRLAGAADGSTRLELDHLVPADDDAWRQFGPGAAGVGWDMALLALARHLSGDPATDHGGDPAWPSSDEGKRFASLSSEKWHAADIEAGAGAEEARTGVLLRSR